MKWNAWVRQTHRWLSILFTALVVANVVVNFVLAGQAQLALWLGLFTLLPLLLLLVTGLYLFALPYATRWRSGRPRCCTCREGGPARRSAYATFTRVAASGRSAPKARW